MNQDKTPSPGPEITGSPEWLKTRLEAILEKQRRDMNKRLADRGYWGDTGYWVGEGLDVCIRVLNDLPTAPPVARWVQGKATELEARLTVFRQQEEDPDGYGSATIQEVLGDLRGILTELHKEEARRPPPPGLWPRLKCWISGH